MGALGGGDRVEDRVDLVGRLVLVAADLELDERGVSVLRDLARVAGVERRADVLDGLELRDAGDDVLDRGLEGRIARRERAALDRTLSPAGCLKPASRILSMRPDSPGPAVFGSMVFVPTMPPSPKATSDEREPAERRGLPVSGAPATHAARAARLRLRVRGAGHARSSLSGARRRTGGRRRRGRGRARPRAGSDLRRARPRPRRSARSRRVPEQQDVDAVALAGCELAGLPVCVVLMAPPSDASKCMARR